MPCPTLIRRIALACLVLLSLTATRSHAQFCCLPDGTCISTTTSCTSVGGHIVATCGTCQLGACCSGGSCVVLTQPSCVALAGRVFLGAGVTCTGSPCLGACCTAAGACSLTASTACAGTYNGRGTTCSPTACQGACCTGAGVCTLTSQSGCTTVFQGIGTACSPGICLGSCCHNTGACDVRSGADCDGQFGGFNTTCSASLCAGPNDWCARAYDLTEGVTFSGDSTAYTYNAGTDGPTPPCIAFNGGAVHALWFAFTPARTDDYNIVIGPVRFATAVTVFTDCQYQTVLACNGLDSGQGPVIQRIRLNAGTRYLIRQGGYAAASYGPYSIRVEAFIPTGACCVGGVCTRTLRTDCTGRTFIADSPCTPYSCPPDNDACADAIALTLGTDFNGSNANSANGEDGPRGSCEWANFSAVWHTFTPAVTTDYSITTCDSAIRSSVTVFTTADCASFTQVPGGCSSNSPACYLRGYIPSLRLTAGTRYTIRVGEDAASFPQGSYRVRIDATSTLGACCSGQTCALSGAADCRGAGQRFAPGRTACTPGFCCPGDFNLSAAVSVQDIFDFLAAYFAGSPSADVNASGDVSVQDIFDYMASYFHGCA